MACKECKKKKLKDEYLKTTNFTPKGVVIFIVVWSVLALYGLFELISKFV